MWPSPKTAYLLLTGYGLLSSASPIESEGHLEERQSCPSIHIFGARETTASPGYGSSSTVVNAVLSAYPGSTAEAITYPACGGQASCGGASYSSSVQQGIAAAASAVNSFYTRCPSTQLVLVGYSQVSEPRFHHCEVWLTKTNQGAEIFDVALCGGGDPNQGYTNTAVQLSAGAVGQVKAAILMGAPTYVYGLSYDVGTCKAGGVSHHDAHLTLRVDKLTTLTVRCSFGQLQMPICREDPELLRRPRPLLLQWERRSHAPRLRI